MATLQVGNGPRTHITTGNRVLRAAEAVGTRPVRAKLLAFRRMHRRYVDGHARVVRAESRLSRQQVLVTKLDREQDDALERVADALVVEGAPRANPFKPFGFPAPSALRRMPAADEGAHLLQLSLAIRKRLSPRATEATRRALARMDRAAAAVVEAAAGIYRLQEDRRAALDRRNALAPGWRTSFSSLKRATRVAEDDGAHGLYTVLFGRAGTMRRTRRKPPPPVAQM